MQIVLLTLDSKLYVTSAAIYQTHGRFVLFGGPVFKLTMNDMAQKTRAPRLTFYNA